jgi:hypothetical protein
VQSHFSDTKEELNPNILHYTPARNLTEHSEMTQILAKLLGFTIKNSSGIQTENTSQLQRGKH